MRCNISVGVNQQRKEQTPMIGGLCISVYKEPNGTPNGLSKCMEGSRGLDDEGDHVVGSSPLKGNGEDQSVFSCSSSSIGENSNSGNPSTLTSCNEDGVGGDMEVQSSYKSPLDNLSNLEESLPIKRGISKFFSGKSRSFTSLSDAVSIKDLAKPDNPYSKRRRNLLACSNNWDRQRFYPSRNSSAGISKKGYHSSKSTLAVAVSMSNSQNNIEGYEHDLRLPPLPPLPRQVKSQSTAAAPRSFSVRSFSLTDLQGIDCRPSFARF